MMNSQEVVTIYETIAVITGQMVSAARDSDWKQLATLEKQCAQHIEIIKINDVEAAQGAMRERKIKVIQKILADDREIRNITQPWMARLSTQINSTNSSNTRRKLTQAYGLNNRPS
jgi:flagellar protein FliT